MFYFRHRGARPGGNEAFDALLAGRCPAAAADDPFWQQDGPPSTLIDEVERVWSAIDDSDDWTALHAKVAAIRELGRQLGPAPKPAGHVSLGSS